jgi:hypothetical protein
VPKVHNKPIKRPSKGFKQESKRQPGRPLVWRTGLSGVPTDSVRCTRALEAELFTFGNFQGGSAKIHRTVRCDSRATATSRATVDCNTLNARLRAQRSRARAGGTPDSLQGLSGAPPDSQAGPQVRAPTVEPQRSADVAGAPDCPMRHATAAFQQPYFGGWGYKYPNHPTFNGIQVFPLLHLTRAITFNTRHTKVIKPSPNSTRSFSD